MCVCVCFETVWFRVRFGHEQMKNNIFCFEKKKSPQTDHHVYSNNNKTVGRS